MYQLWFCQIGQLWKCNHNTTFIIIIFNPHLYYSICHSRIKMITLHKYVLNNITLDVSSPIFIRVWQCLMSWWYCYNYMFDIKVFPYVFKNTNKSAMRWRLNMIKVLYHFFAKYKHKVTQMYYWFMSDRRNT